MNFLVDERLNEKQLRRLKDHVYSSSGKSILDNKVVWTDKTNLTNEFEVKPILELCGREAAPLACAQFDPGISRWRDRFD